MYALCYDITLKMGGGGGGGGSGFVELSYIQYRVLSHHDKYPKTQKSKNIVSFFFYLGLKTFFALLFLLYF